MDTTSPQPASAELPTLPPSVPRPAPTFERRDVEITLVRPERRGPSRRTYRLTALAFGAVAAGAWFALAEYIYG